MNAMFAGLALILAAPALKPPKDQPPPIVGLWIMTEYSQNGAPLALQRRDVDGVLSRRQAPLARRRRIGHHQRAKLQAHPEIEAAGNRSDPLRRQP